MNGSGNRWTSSGGGLKLFPVMRWWFMLVLVELVALLTPAMAGQMRLIAPAGFAVDRPRMQLGDDPAWARPDYDDASWQLVPLSRGPPLLPMRAGPFWVRVRLEPIPGLPGHVRDAISLSIVAAYEVYWDGKLIGRSGVVGHDRESEIPGNLDNLFQIPEALRGQGEHLLALRISSYRAGFPAENFALTMSLGNYRALLTKRGQQPVLLLLAAGGALVVGAVFGLMWLLADRRPVTLLFSALCFTGGLIQALQAWRWLSDYPFDWHYPRLLVISWLVVLLGVLLTAYVQMFFQVPYRRTRLVALLVLMALGWQTSHLYHVKSLAVAVVSIVVTATAVGWAIWRGRRSAWFVAGGLAIFGLVVRKSPFDLLEQSFFLSFGAPLFGCVVAHVLQWRDDRRQARAAMLTSTRLEVELLKKNIQPHFLLNTLASLLEVIERSPSGAAPMIEALAGEFRILARVSGEKLISLGQELELCDCHLRVMSMRRGTSWQLERIGLDLDVLVPPALFHTLIENGITHSEGRARSRMFRLYGELGREVTRFTLIAPMVESADALAGVRENETIGERNGSTAEGTGLRYVKARLEESFPGAWSLRAGPTLEGWQTVIELKGVRRSVRATVARPHEAPATAAQEGRA